MKFPCDHCGTRYTLSDEKVRNKVLKIRCKVCENIMVVRDPNAGRPAVKAPALRPPSPPPAEEDRTQLSNPLGAGFDAEWYAAAAGMQHGPMPIERLIDEIRQGQVKADDLVWNATMDDWRPASEVPELQGVVRARAAARRPRLAPPPPVPDDEATVVQGSPDLFRLEASRGPEEVLTREVSAAVDALHPVDTTAEPAAAQTPAPDDVDTTLWPATSGDPDETVAAAPPAAEAPVVPAPEAEAPEPTPEPAPAPTPAPPAAPIPEPESEAPSHPAPPSAGPAIPSFSEPPAAPASTPAAEGDEKAGWMASLADHLEDAPVAQQAGEIHAITQTAPPKKTPWGRIALVLLLLVGVGLAAFFMRGDPPTVAPDAGVATAAAAVDAAPPPPPQDALPKPADAAPVVDAGQPDAAPASAPASVAKKGPAKRPGSKAKGGADKPKPRKKPKTASSKAPSKRSATKAATKKRPATGLAALDSNRKVEVAPPSQPVERLPEQLSRGQISGMISRNKAGLQACYQRQLKRDPSMRGVKLQLKFTVERDGRAKKVSLPRRFNNTVLKTCLSSLVRRWRFPKFTGDPMPVEYPLVFQASL